ncbi:TldD/PmbA family protein [Parabacteroides sp. OttesenSCG-928-K15]|nr:TldD/PmbA family protein [Parabacteroides sp. OttesenSCG-928-K15]
MITEDNKRLARWAMEYALKQGCQASRISIYYGSNSTFEVRDMKIDRLQQASENSMSIQLYVDGRYGGYSTNRLNKVELEKFIKDSIDATRYLAEDKARALPDPSRYYKGGKPDLQLFDARFDAIEPDQKVALAMQACDEIMGKDARLISANASYADEKSASYRVASNGFEGETASSYYRLSAGASIRGEGEARPESYWSDSALYYDTLQKQAIGTTALERVLQKLGQQKVASGKYKMIVDNLNISQLVSPLLSALYGSSIQQKNSFLLDKLNEKVVGENLTFMDDPHQMRAFGARYFDGEGVATQRMPIIEKGVLKTYFIDTYSANKMGVAPTISGPSIITMPLGTKDKEGIIRTMDKGILVTGFNGGNSNSSTGDFSYGIEGFLVENGKITQPVSEMNITGNILTLCNNILEIGNDPRHNTSWKIPSMLFDGVDFSGL